MAEKVDWIRRLAKERERSLSFGIRLHVLSRDTSAAAWASPEASPATIINRRPVSIAAHDNSRLGAQASCLQ